MINRVRKTAAALLLLIILPFVLVVGCSTTKPLTEHDRTRINTVALPDEIIVQDIPFYHGMSESLGAGVGGIIGGLIATSGPSIPQRILKFMSDNDISIQEITKSNFENAVKSGRQFLITDKLNADASFVVTVEEYGFERDYGFSPKVKPYQVVNAKLIDRNGKLIWENTSSIRGTDSDVIEHDIDVWLSDRELFMQGFEEVTISVAKKLVLSLSDGQQ